MTIPEEKEYISKMVNSLEVCWWCDRVTECSVALLGDWTIAYLCQRCIGEIMRQAPGAKRWRCGRVEGSKQNEQV